LSSLLIAASSCSAKASSLQFLHDVGGAGEKHVEAVLDERATDGRCTVALAGSGRAEKQQVGRLVEPGVAGGECHDACLVQHRHDREVEIIECFAEVQMCLGEIPHGPQAARSAISSSASAERNRAAGQPSLSARSANSGQSLAIAGKRSACGSNGRRGDRAHDSSPTCGVLSRAS
jgi:hypothetical protein